MNLVISLIVFSILGVFCSFLLWKKYGDDDPVVKKVVKAPPQKLNSAELGFFLKGEALREDMLTLFLSLANKGYLKVKEVEDEVLFVKNKTFKVIKIKEYTGKNEYEKMFFDIMFENKDEVTENELRKIFSYRLKNLEKKLESKTNIKKIFEDTGSIKGMLVLIIGILVLLLTLALPMFAMYGPKSLIVSMFLVVLEVLAFSSVNSIPEYDYSKKRNVILGIVLFFEFLFFISIPFVSVKRLFYAELMYRVVYCVGLFCFAIIVFIRRYMAKRTKWGIELLGEVEGFKDYLLNQKEIEEKLNKNNQYIYEMLPYIYVLGLIDEWNKVYCNEKLEKPNWYELSDEFELDIILDFIENLLTM